MILKKKQFLNTLKNVIVVNKSGKNMYLKILSFDRKFIITSCSSLDKNVRRIIFNKNYKFNSLNSAILIGKFLAINSIKKGINRFFFDRSGYKFHGKVKNMFNSFNIYFNA